MNALLYSGHITAPNVFKLVNGNGFPFSQGLGNISSGNDRLLVDLTNIIAFKREELDKNGVSIVYLTEVNSQSAVLGARRASVGGDKASEEGVIIAVERIVAVASA